MTKVAITTQPFNFVELVLSFIFIDLAVELNNTMFYKKYMP